MNPGFVIAGGTLQFAGISCAAIGVYKVRTNWTTRRGVIGQATDYFLSILKWIQRKPKAPEATLTGATGGATVGASFEAKVLRATDPRLSRTQRDVEDLMSQISDLQNELSFARLTQDEQALRTNAVLAGIQQDLERIREDLTKQIQGLASGGLQVQSWGVFLLLLGTIFTMVGSLMRT
jgi:hypothetical protein